MRFLTVCGLALMGAAMLNACSNNNESSDSNSNDADKQQVDMTPRGDSLTVLSGQLIGAMLNQRWEANLAELPADVRARLTKEEFLRGFKDALNIDTAVNYMMGFQAGLEQLNGFLGPMSQREPMDFDKFYETFEAEFNSPTLDDQTLAKLQDQISDISYRINQEQAKRLKDKASEAPEAVANTKAGNEYLAKVKAADADVKTSSTGLAYKIANPGSGAKATDNDIVSLRYTGKTIDGNVFDQSGTTPIDLSPKQVIPGFSEGLKLLGKGGKATLYIPGDIAYGPYGIPEANIGPNEMLIFDIEIVDIKPAK